MSKDCDIVSNHFKDSNLVDLVGYLFGSLVTDNMARRYRNGQRLGQAFYNSIPITYQDKLVGTQYDPFQRDDSRSVYATLDYLTR